MPWTCRPRGIREHLGLNKPIYARTSAYGHFGRAPEADGGFSWERTDLADALKRPLSADSPMSDRHGSERDRRLLRPPEGQEACGPARTELVRRFCRALRVDPPAATPAAHVRRARRERDLARDRLRRRRASGRPGASPSARSASSAASRSSTAWRSSWPAIEQDRLDNVRIWDEDVTDLLPTPAGCVSRPRLPSLSRSLAEAPPAQAPPRLRRDAARTRARHAAGRRAALRQRHRRLRRLDARAACCARPISLDGDGPDDWRKPYEGWPAPATRPRRAARAACRAICVAVRI